MPTKQLELFESEEEISKMPVVKTTQPEKCNTRQIRYMEILFNDLKYTWDSRNAYLQHRFSDPKIKHLDELTYYQASNVIEHLKSIKESLKR